MSNFTIQVEDAQILDLAESINNAFLMMVAINDSVSLMSSSMVGVRIPSLNSDDGRTITIPKREKILIVNDCIIS